MKNGFWILIGLGLLFVIGGLIASRGSIIDFALNPAGILGVILLVWVYVIKKRKRQ